MQSVPVLWVAQRDLKLKFIAQLNSIKIGCIRKGVHLATDTQLSAF